MSDDPLKKSADFLKTELQKRKYPLILIVEDDENDITMLRRALELLDYHNIIISRDASEAAKIMDKQAIDLVFIDLKLPMVSGVDFIREQMKLDPNRFLVVVTGAKDSEAVNEALRAGAALVFQKPVSASDLSTILTSKPLTSNGTRTKG